MLYVIVPRNTLTDFLFAELRNASWVKVIEHPQPRRSFTRTVLKSLEVYILSKVKQSYSFDRNYIDQLKSIAHEDTVLFFSIENRKELQIILKFIAAKDLHQWIWNPVGNFRRTSLSRALYLSWLARRGIKSYTFDPADAERFGFKQRPQVFRRITTECRQDLRHDVYFLGNDKGRFELLKEWKSRLEQGGFTTYFHIVADKKLRYTAHQRTQVVDEWITYQANIDIIKESRCLLELLQSSQSGPTLRSLEAAFFAKKLITNNKSIRHTALYSPARIFIIGEDDPLDLRAFIDSELDPVAESILAQYEIEGWIKGFCVRAPDCPATPRTVIAQDRAVVQK